MDGWMDGYYIRTLHTNKPLHALLAWAGCVPVSPCLALEQVDDVVGQGLRNDGGLYYLQYRLSG